VSTTWAGGEAYIVRWRELVGLEYSRGVKPEGPLDATVSNPYATASDARGSQEAPDGAVPLPLVAVPGSYYEIVGEQGRGGIGVVLRARDRRLDRLVALKQLQVARGHSQARFEREMRITARLQHPGVVPVHEAGCFESGVPFYAMKLIEGRSLRRCIEETTSTGERLALLPHLLAVAEAVAYAHSQGIIHRDLKPENIIVGAFGEAIVIDWGLAKDLGEAAESPAAAAADGTVSGSGEGFTVGGDVIGTPAYMPPEQARGAVVDKRADVWSLGAVLYHVLTGRPPYSGGSAPEVLELVHRSPPAPLAEVVPELPDELATIVAHAMAREPADRYADAGELAQDLRRFATGQLVGAHRYTVATLLARWLRKHRAAVAVAALSLLVLLVGGVISLRNVLASKRQTEAERRVAVRERGVAQQAREAADARARDLLLAQARALLGTDPTLSLAWSREYLRAGGDVRQARTLAGDAWSRTVARRDLHIDAGALCATFLPDSRKVAIGSDDGSVRILDTETGVLRPAGRVNATLMFPRVDGRGRLAVCDNAGDLYLWDLEHGQPARVAAAVCGRHGADPRFVLDDHAIAVTDGKGRLRLVDLGDGHDLPLPEIHPEWYEIGRNGRSVIFGEGKALVTLALDTGARRSYPVTGELYSANTSPDGTRVAISWTDGSIWVLDGAGERLAQLTGPREPFVTFSRDDRRMVAAGLDGRLHLWSFDSGQDVELWHGLTGLKATEFLPDGQRLLVQTDDSSVVMFRVDDGSMVPITPHARQGGELAISPDGTRLVTYHASGSVRLYLIDDGPPAVLRASIAPAASALVVDPAGKHAAFLGAHGEVTQLDLATGQAVVLGSVHAGEPQARVSQSRRGPRLAYAPGGARLAASGADGVIHVFDVGGPGATVEHLLAGHVEDVFGLAFVDEGKTLASGGQDGTVRLWDVDAGTSRTLATTAAVRSLAVSPSRRWLASGDKSGEIHVWSLPGGEPVRTLSGHQQSVLALAFSPGEDRLASAGSDATVRVWPLDGSAARVLTGHAAWTDAVAFSPDGRRLASGGADANIRIWELESGSSRVLSGHEGWVLTLEFSADGARLLSGSGDKTARLWDLSTGESRPVPHTARVSYAHFLPGDRQVVSGGAEVRSWSDALPESTPGLLAWIDAHIDAVVAPAGQR
jgi:WD40 repeat protein/tRNA A-37 threonylcarbamoyl transferase component Bud32